MRTSSVLLYPYFYSGFANLKVLSFHELCKLGVMCVCVCVFVPSKYYSGQTFDLNFSQQTPNSPICVHWLPVCHLPAVKLASLPTPTPLAAPIRGSLCLTRNYYSKTHFTDWLFTRFSCPGIVRDVMLRNFYLLPRLAQTGVFFGSVFLGGLRVTFCHRFCSWDCSLTNECERTMELAAAVIPPPPPPPPPLPE